ncbi:MAG: hypothetical protein ACI8TL_001462 [Natronomonas sp.]|jgi:hypothetical protein
MTDDTLEGTRLPSGEYEVEGWQAHLWADATRNDEDAYRYDDEARAVGEPGQLVPQSMCQHIVFQASGGIDEVMGMVSEDWTSGAALGGLRVDFHTPIEAGQTLKVEGRIDSVVEKEGSSGPLTIVTYSYTVTAETGDEVYDLEVDLILMEGA